MEQIIKEMKLANKKLREIIETSEAIIQDLSRVQTVWGNEVDNQNGDSNMEREG